MSEILADQACDTTVTQTSSSSSSNNGDNNTIGDRNIVVVSSASTATTTNDDTVQISGGETASSEANNNLELEIENATDMADSYVRTRHKNMRCFPRCSPVHKTKSFCGQSLYVAVKGRVLKKEEVIVVGEFRNTRQQPSFTVGQSIPTYEFTEKYTEGVLLRQINDQMFFAINPIRKWKFDSKLRPMDHYVFTVFLVVQGNVLAMTDTPSFSIVPIWKLPGGEDDEEEEAESATTITTQKLPKVAYPRSAKKHKQSPIDNASDVPSAMQHALFQRFPLDPSQLSPQYPLHYFSQQSPLMPPPPPSVRPQMANRMALPSSNQPMFDVNNPAMRAAAQGFLTPASFSPQPPSTWAAAMSAQQHQQRMMLGPHVPLPPAGMQAMPRIPYGMTPSQQWEMIMATNQGFPPLVYRGVNGHPRGNTE